MAVTPAAEALIRLINVCRLSVEVLQVISVSLILKLLLVADATGLASLAASIGPVSLMQPRALALTAVPEALLVKRMDCRKLLVSFAAPKTIAPPELSVILSVPAS